MEGEEEQDEEKEEHQSLHDRITAIKQNSQRQDGKEPAMRTTEACIGQSFVYTTGEKCCRIGAWGYAPLNEQIVVWRFGKSR